jgi:ABC-type uncharacterized transport system substrate-binding protein
MKKNGFILLCLIIIFCPAAAISGGNDILVIESYHAEYPWDISYKEGIEETLGNRYKLTYFEMDTKRLPESVHPKMGQLAFEKYLQLKPALVMLGDDNALKYVGPKLSETQTPVVYLGINQNLRAYFNEKPLNFTGVIERPVAKRSIHLMNTLIKPTPKKIMVLFDSGITSKASIKSIFDDQSSTTIIQTKVDLFQITFIDDWENAVLTAKEKGYDAIAVGLYHTITDKNGNHVDSEKIIKWTSEKTQLPTFAFWDFAVGHDKTMGGVVLSGRGQGLLASELALKALKGITPSEIPLIKGNEGLLLFSKKQLERFKIILPDSIKNNAKIIE